jgi:hypothetical protein
MRPARRSPTAGLGTDLAVVVGWLGLTDADVLTAMTDYVLAVRDHKVATGAAADHVGLAIANKRDVASLAGEHGVSPRDRHISLCPGKHAVVTRTTEGDIDARAGVGHIGSGATALAIISVPAPQQVAFAAAAEGVVARLAEDLILLLSACDGVVAVSAVEVVASAPAIDAVAARVPVDLVPSATGIDLVVSFAADDLIRPAQGVDHVVPPFGVDLIRRRGPGEDVGVIVADDGRRRRHSHRERENNGPRDNQPRALSKSHACTPPSS